MFKFWQKFYIYARNFLKKVYRGNFHFFLWIFPIRRNKIVITNYYGKGYGDNSKYIVENILKRNLNFEIVWLINKDAYQDIPKQIRQVKYKSFAALFELATAKIWIDNCRKIYFPPKKKSQYYIQTWHGNFPLKRIEKDAENSLGNDYIYTAKLDSRICDYFISNSNFMTRLYTNSFWFFGQIIELGSPRNDIFFIESSMLKKKVSEVYEFAFNMKVCLYAPTFRKIKNENIFLSDFNEIKQNLKKRFGSEWIVLVRLHPNDTEMFYLYEGKEEVINVSNYPDMQELLLVSDVLITDYSSSMFDYLLSKKPCFLYMSDLQDYIGDRNFYFELNEIPFPKSQNSSELKYEIINFNINKYFNNINEFIDRYNINDNGNASERVVNFILEKCEEIK